MDVSLASRETVQADGFAGAPSVWKTTKYQERLARCYRIIEGLRPASVLDVGAGDGLFLDRLTQGASWSPMASGIELNGDAVRRMKDKGYDAYEVSATSAYPFADGQFELVFAGEVIEHVFDPDAMLRECRRVLSPTGHLLLTTPNLLAWHNRLLMLAGITPFFVEHSYEETYGPKYSLLRKPSVPAGHLRIYNLAPLQALLKRNGFLVTAVDGCAFLPFPGLFQIDKAISRARPGLASLFVVTATLT